MSGEPVVLGRQSRCMPARPEQHHVHELLGGRGVDRVRGHLRDPASERDEAQQEAEGEAVEGELRGQARAAGGIAVGEDPAERDPPPGSPERDQTA